MGDSYTNLLYHIIFSTKDRRPLITPDYEVRLYDYIGGTIRGLGGTVLKTNVDLERAKLIQTTLAPEMSKLDAQQNEHP